MHKPSQSSTFLLSVQEVQRHLAANSYPCPRPVCGLQRLAQGIAVGEELIDEGFYVDGHDPAIRRMMAEALAQLVRLTHGLVDLPGFRATMLHHREIDGLWERPHNKLFDFVATTKGAEWIDAIRANCGSGPILVKDELILEWRFFFSAENEAPCSSCCSAFTKIEPVSHDTSKSVEIEPNLPPGPFHLKDVNLSPMEGPVKMKGTAPGGSPTGVGEKLACRDSPGYTAQR